MASASPKILSARNLLAWREEQRRRGQTVVHCHGCFDIVHPGHIAHLQQARSLGDVLLVTVSSDANVNKGHARPLIPDDLRAASLAALECVDAVHVNNTPTAVDLLEALKPDVFVKGKEYERSADPRFLLEKDTVIAGGGRVVFTSGEIVYSSTAIINNLTQTDPFEREKLARLLGRYDLTAGTLAQTIRAFEGKRIAVVGDTLLDAYHFCDATGVASEGPMMSLKLLARKDYDGGAAVIARHAAALGAQVTLVTHLPDESSIKSRLEDAGIEVRGLTGRKTQVTKHRYLCDTTKVMKLDEGSPQPIDSAAIDALTRTLTALADDGLDAVIFADFGYGMLSPTLLDAVLPKLKSKVPVITGDVSGRTGTLLRFQNAALLTPTERELREALGDFSSSLPALAWNAIEATGAHSLTVTLGRQGAIVFDHGDNAAPSARLRQEHIPAFTKHALDPLGCGDALLTTATLALAAGASAQAATLLGSLAAAYEASRLGNEAIATDDLLTQLQALPEVDQPHTLRLAS